MSPARIGAILIAALALGFALGGVRVRTPLPRNAEPARSATAPAVSGAAHAAETASTPVSKLAPAVSADLDGKEFVRAFPALQALARGGNVEAMRLLYKRLGSCAMFQPKSDEQIRADENVQWQRQIEITRELNAAHPDRPIQPPFDEPSLIAARDKAVQQEFDRRDLCTGLSARQLGSRIDWLQLLLDRRDRASVLDAALAATVNVRSVERVRTAEQLVQLAASERTALDALVAGGDLDAIQRGMNAYRDGEATLLPRDAELAYAYAYALSLVGARLKESRQQEVSSTMKLLSEGRGGNPPLTAEQIDKARAAGLALYKRCCAAGAG